MRRETVVLRLGQLPWSKEERETAHVEIEVPESIKEAIEFLGEDRALKILKGEGHGVKLHRLTRARMVLKEGGTIEQAERYAQIWDPKASPVRISEYRTWQEILSEEEE